MVERHCARCWVHRLAGHTCILPPAATAHSGRNCTGRHWLPVIVRHDLGYPLRNIFSPPSHLLRTQNVKEKNSHPNPGGIFTRIHTHLLRPRTRKCLVGINRWSMPCVNPTTGVGTLGEGGLTLTGRQRGLLVLSPGGARNQCVIG